MKKETQHTPTPWKQHETDGKTYASIRGKNNETIADCGSRSDQQAQANAEFIVRAVNSHEVLLSALKRTKAFLLNGSPADGDPTIGMRVDESALYQAIKDAITQAERP